MLFHGVLLWDALVMQNSVTVVNSMLLTGALTRADLTFDLQASYDVSVLPSVSFQKASFNVFG